MPEVTYIGLPAMIARAEGALRIAVAQAAEDLQGRAQEVTPVGPTGNLKAGIHVEGPFGGGAEVTARVATGGEASEYAIFVHEGTGPHWIEPTTGYLYWPGAAHPVQRVFHPGTQAQKYIERPLLAMKPVYRAFIAKAARAAF